MQHLHIKPQRDEWLNEAIREWLADNDPTRYPPAFCAPTQASKTRRPVAASASARHPVTNTYDWFTL